MTRFIHFGTWNVSQRPTIPWNTLSNWSNLEGKKKKLTKVMNQKMKNLTTHPTVSIWVIIKMKINWYLVTTQYIDTEPWQRHSPPLLLREYLGGRRKGGKLIAGLKIPVKRGQEIGSQRDSQNLMRKRNSCCPYWLHFFLTYWSNNIFF